MLRNGSALFFSFMIHTALAAGAVGLYYTFQQQVMPKEENKVVRICLSQVKEVVQPPVVVSPPPPPVVKTPPPKVAEPKVVTKPLPQPKPEPKPIVKKVEKVEPKVEKIPEVEPVVVAEVIPLKVKEPVTFTPAPPVKSAEECYMEEHLQLIAQLLKKNLYYPKRARKRHIEGEVVMVFELLQNGHIGTVDVKDGSRDILNSAAIKTIKKLSGRVPKPPQNITIEIPIQFKLTS